MAKLFTKLNDLKEKIKSPVKRAAKRQRATLEEKISSLICSFNLSEIIRWDLTNFAEDAFDPEF